MKLTNITNALSSVSGRTGLVLKKHSPEILLVVGIAGVIGSTVLACRAMLCADDVLEEHEEKLEKIEQAKEQISLEKYSEDDRRRDLVVVYTQTAVEFIKLYGPAVTLGIASICCIVGAHGIMKKRNVALMAAYKALEEGFNAYRKRVVDEYGEDKDYMLKHGLTAEQVTEMEITEDGKTKKVKKTKLVEDPNGLSVYARFFDESCSQWSNTPEYNLLFLKSQQSYFNQMLIARGHVFLSEVYDALGMERSQASIVTGWVRGKGDDFIDFGIYNDDNPRARDFVNGLEKSILLDFNVDGVIYDLI